LRQKNSLDTNYDEESVNYEIKYKKEFKKYFHCYYKDTTVNLRAEAQRASNVNEIMHYNNAIDLLLTIYSLLRLSEDHCFDNLSMLVFLKTEIIDIFALTL